MIIVLEGPDNSGKTTLAKKLVKRFNAHYLHLTYRWPGNMFLYHTAAISHACDLVTKTQRPVVIDRWWPSELVYGKVFRNETETGNLCRMLDRKLLTFNGFYIFCLPSIDNDKYEEKFLKDSETKGEMYSTVKDVFKKYKEFYYGFQTFSGLNLNAPSNWPHTTIWDYITMDDDYIFSVCELKLKMQKNFSRFNLGNLFLADTLFIGEEAPASGQFRKDLGLYFNMSNHSKILNDILDDYYWDEWRGYWYNAKYCFKTSDIYTKIGFGSIKNVVCFGRKAHDVFRQFFSSAIPGNVYVTPEISSTISCNKKKMVFRSIIERISSSVVYY